MSKVLISNMTQNDLEGIYEVEKTAFSIPWSISSFEEELNNVLANYLVAKLDKKIVGYLGFWFVIDECHITNIAVHEDFRRQHIATKLIKKMFKLCKEHHASYIVLEVRASNFAAQEFYSKFGFKKEFIRKDYYKNPDGTREDAIIMSHQ